MMGIRIPKDRILLVHVAEGKNTLEEFMAQLSDVDLIELVGGRPNRGPADTYGMGDLEEYGVPAMMTADGPGGLRFKKNMKYQLQRGQRLQHLLVLGILILFMKWEEPLL